MIRLEWVFFIQLIIGSLMVIFLQKQMKMKKQLDEMTREVTNYISYITEDIIEETQENAREETCTKENVRNKEDAQNRLIQAVLGEYFP